jgi:surfactin synthase thioesterase subunit
MDGPGLKLFCFPFAGGSASAYRRWRWLAPPDLRVCAVEYPGRGALVAREPFVRLPPLVRDLADRLEPQLDRPYALFGHSMGGLVAFELVRALRERGARPPCHLFVSATAAPGTPPGRPSLVGAGDREVLAELRDLGGTPRELLDDGELMAMAVRALRADYSALGTYEFRPAAPLDVPITVLGGRYDEIVPPGRLRGWQAHSAAGYRLKLLPAGHFYVDTAAEEILATVAEAAGALAGRH